MCRCWRPSRSALLYFEVITTLALFIGLVVVNVVRPGEGMHVDPRTLDASGLAGYASAAKGHGTASFLLGIIPDSVVGAFATGNILQVLLFAVLFGFALVALGEAGRPVVEIIERFTRGFFGVVAIVMRLAPLGAFGAMAFTIG